MKWLLQYAVAVVNAPQRLDVIRSTENFGYNMPT